MSEDLKRNFGLDILRATAISLVVASHCTYMLFPNTSALLIEFIRTMGAIGVDLFFVLSGYLIGGLILKRLENQELEWCHLFGFWKRRWLRTLPNYFLLLILNILLAFLTGFDLPEGIPHYFVFLQNFWNPHPNFFTEAWSLSIEEYAYLFLPFLVFSFAILRPKSDKSKWFLSMTISIIFILNLLKLNYFHTTNIHSYGEWSAAFRKVVVYRMDSIYLGFLLVYLIKRRQHFITNYRFVFLALSIIILGIVHYLILKYQILPQNNLLFYVFFYLPIIGFSLALLFPFFLNLDYKGRGKQVVVFISKRSYAIYLINYSIVLLTFQRLIDISVFSWFGKIVSVMAFLFITILLSHFLYNYFESPILKWRDRKFPR